MSNDMLPASNEESTTELASYLIDELTQSTNMRENFKKNDFQN